MENFTDISIFSDNAYKLAETINGGHYSEILYYEFHEAVDPTSIWNCLEGLESFTIRNDKFYSIFISHGFVDQEPAIIHIALKLGNEWFIAHDCGANYYGGYGPTGIYKLREACFNKNILAFAITDNFEEWIKQKFKHPKNSTRIKKKSIDQSQFESLIKSLQYLTCDMQRRPDQFQLLSEENIRDRLLTTLNVTFKGRGNAEAKNCKGKTDILIRTKDGLNEHIFELKVWKGIKTLQETIQQLQGYLSWHNNYAGIIIFCYNSNFTKIINETETYLKNNHNFTKREKIIENEFRFKLEHQTDEHKKIETVLTLINLKINQKKGNN
jgi:hypothetical protein